MKAMIMDSPAKQLIFLRSRVWASIPHRVLLQSH